MNLIISLDMKLLTALLDIINNINYNIFGETNLMMVTEVLDQIILAIEGNKFVFCIKMVDTIN